MTDISEKDVYKGQAIYTPFFLRLYNLYVLDFSNSWIWRCPKRFQLSQFNRYVTNNHLDIGIGTGYYLKQCKWPAHTSLALMDLNPNCLSLCKASLAALKPEIYQADIFKAQPELSSRFDSISMNYLLHCLPGTMDMKSQAIGNAADMLKPSGILFGATILADVDINTKISSQLASFYSKKGIFSNQHDTLKALKNALETHLSSVEIEIRGAVALFKGRRD